MAKQRGSMFTAVVFDVLAHSGEEVEVFRVFARPHFLFAQRVGADEFVGGALEVAQLKLRLAEPQMQKGVADGIWAVHRVTEGVAGGFVAAAQKFGVAHPAASIQVAASHSVCGSGSKSHACQKRSMASA